MGAVREEGFTKIGCDVMVNSARLALAQPIPKSHKRGILQMTFDVSLRRLLAFNEFLLTLLYYLII